MRILHVIADIDPTSGGTAAAFVKLTSAQARAGLAVTAVATYRLGADLSGAQEMARFGVKVCLLGPAAGPLRWAWGMGRTIRDLVASANIVHIHAIWEEIQHRAAREARRARVPYIFLPHGMLDPWSLAQKRLKKQLYMTMRLRPHLMRAAGIHVTADVERELLHPLKLAPPVIVEPLGVDLAEFELLPPKGWLRARYPQIANRPIVLFLGRLHPKKGLDLLIPAFAHADTADAVLVLAGPAEPKYLAKLRAAVHRQGIDNRVIFAGMLRGIERIQAYVDSDLFVLPSYQENFGIAVVEAAATGCPVLISDQVNIWQDVRDAGVGGVVPVSEAVLCRALQDWMTDRPRREDASRQGPLFARQRYDWNVIARRWTTHYSNIVDSGLHA